MDRGIVAVLSFDDGFICGLFALRGFYLEEALAALASAYAVVLAGRIVPTHRTGAFSLGTTLGRRRQAVS